MALLLVEGFEGFGSGTGAAPQPTNALNRAYTVVSESNMDIETGRITGYSLEFGSTACEIKTGTLTTDDTLIIGFAVKFSVIDNPRMLQLYDGATVGMCLHMNNSGQILVYRAGALLGTSGAVLTSTGTWYYIEFKIKTSNAAGTYEVRVGGVNVLSDSGVDTQPGGNAYHDIAKFEFDWGAGTMHLDDIYICDSSGAQNNDFLGNCQVTAIIPDGDDSAGWDTASGGAAHYLDVDENPADDDTTYIEDATTGHKDLFDYAAMAAGLGAVKGLEIKTVCRETDATSYNIIMPIKSGVTETDDSAQSVGSTNYLTRTRVSELNPNGSVAWTKTTIDAAKFGVKTG